MSVAHTPAQLTTVFAALADETRMEIVDRLAAGAPRSIVQLADGLGITHQGVTKHLKVLENAGLVSSRKIGREKRFVCIPNPLREASGYLEQVSARWDAALVRLKDLVED